ncbi:MAG: glycerophosphodiester phosphodiesterase family protein [Cetobacterium sp.]|uniref:glycerophosphodiester phosphodiesterase family protein n=1 Tax=Cetobacterium sp. TaxID=2071632 RepID=UPI003F2FC1FD
MNNIFFKELEEKKILIAAHRGTYGGNVIENTYLSSIVALASGADIIEIDAVKSTDGVLYAFHDGEEERRFGISTNLRNLSSKEIESMEYLNIIGEKSGEYIWKLYDLFKALKGKGLINLDRAWDYLDEVFEIIKELQMENQIIIKTHPTEEAFNYFKNNETKLMYMPIARKKDDILKFIHSEINMVAAEVLFTKKDDEIIEEEFLKSLAEKNIKIWVNAITLGGYEKHNLSAFQDDNDSLLNDGAGWSWLIDKKIDIIQTDWPYLLKMYINKK